MVYRPTARVLATLELLQAHGQMTGGELAHRLEVDRRTVRNYIETLRDLGVPIAATRGRAGSYQLRPGAKLPPLIFSEDEAVAVVLGLLSARRSGLADEAHLNAVLAKMARVLPEATRLRVDAVAGEIDLEPASAKPAPAPQTISLLAEAVHTCRRVRVEYTPASGPRTVREFDCYGVAECDGAWYAIGYCHLRLSARLFRLDRITAITSLPDTFLPSRGFVPLQAIRAALAGVPRRWTVSVQLMAAIQESQSRVALSTGHFTACEDGTTRVQVEVDDLRWMARTLAGSGLPFVVESPPELCEAILEYAADLVAQVRVRENVPS